VLASTILHGGLVHQAMNKLGLWGAGKLLNRLYGNPQFMLVYLLSALAGASASLHFSAQAAVSVGASGAVFGVLGALVAAVRRHRDQVPKALMKQILTSEGLFLAYALLNGFAREGIDNAAHVGGLVAGALMGWMLAGVVGGEAASRRLPRTAGVAAALLAGVAAMVATTPTGAAIDHGSMFEAVAQMQRIVPGFQAASQAIQKDALEVKAGRMPEERLMAAIESVHLPRMRQLHAQAQQVPLAHGDPRADFTRDLQQLMARSIEGMELDLRAHRGQARPEDPQRVPVLKAEIETVARRLHDRAEAMKPARKP
jgi:rhomboid protease GluP